LEQRYRDGGSAVCRGQIGTLYIVNILLFFLLPTWLAWNLGYWILFILSFFGCYLYFRRLGISTRSSIFASVAFTFGGYVMMQISHYNLIQTVALMPWVLFTDDLFWEKPSFQRLLSFNVVLAQQIFIGFLQNSFVSLVGLFLMSVAQRRERSINDLTKKLAYLFLAVAAAAALAAPQLLPTLELRSISTKREGLGEGQIFQ